MAVLAAQFLALSSIIELIAGEKSTVLVLVFSLAAIFYTCAKGYAGVLLTDKLQLVFIAAALVVFLVVLWGAPNTEATLPEGYFSGTSLGLPILVGALLFFPFTNACEN